MKKSDTSKLERYYASDRAEWRAWLLANHNTTNGVWLIYYKKASGKPRVNYADAVEEALCFGWIDSLPNKLDDERYMQLFTPRRPKSGWSKLNKSRIKKLIRQGLMMDAGYEKIKAAKKDGSWTKLDNMEAHKLHPEFEDALHKNPLAKKNFEAFSPSIRKGIIGWIESAKREETRHKRISLTIEKVAKNLHPVRDKE